MKIGVKLLGGFFLVALLVAAVGVTGIIGLDRMGESADIILDEKMPVADASMEGMIALISGRDAMGEFLLTRNSAELDEIEKEFKETVADFDKADSYIKEHSSGEITALAEKADEYHAQFEKSATELMNQHRLALATEAKAEKVMEKFDEHVDELKKLLGDYEEELTKDQAIDEKVDATMEGKTLMVEQQAIAEEYMGLRTLENSKELRNSFAAIMAEFDKLEHLLPANIKAEHDDFAELAMGKGGMFDLKDEAIHEEEKSMELMGLVDEYSTQGDLTMDKVDESAGRDMEAAMAVADSTMESSDQLIIAITLVAFILAVGIGFIIGRSVTVPLGKTVEMIENLEQGNLDHRLHMDRVDEIGRLAKSMDAFADNLKDEVLEAFERLANGDLTFEAQGLIKEPLAKANEALNEVMGQIQVAGEQIASGSSQVSDSSQSLSQGATEQASSLEEITSSMTEMASQTKTNAENANQANQLAGQARGAADKGNTQMQSMVGAMAEINEAGQNISKIIKVIDEIAFQTNLLALNAAVEAARAGKHGKGFAVVAEEVRNLAARSAQAAKETSELIEGSVEKTENGTEIANQTAAALEEIVSGITKVTDLVGEIAAASNEQAQGISQVNEGLNQIDQVTQQNTANAEESAAASEELSGQAHQLQEMLNRFKLAGQQRQVGQAKVEAPKAIKAAPHQDVEGAWAADTMTTEKKAHPKEVIALNDQEFGKY